MWFDYIKEREGLDSFINEYGFVVYKITSNSLFIQDIYVKPEYRKSQKAVELANIVVHMAKNYRCSNLICQCDLKALNWKDSLDFILKYGCREIKLNGSIMILGKEI